MALLLRKLFYSAKRKRDGHVCRVEVGADANERFPDAAEFQIRELREGARPNTSDIATIQTRRVVRDGVAEHQVSIQVQATDRAGRARTAYGSLALTDEEAAFLAEALTGGAQKFVKG